MGVYAYGIADYGNIIAIASDSDHVDQLWLVQGHFVVECFSMLC